MYYKIKRLKDGRFLEGITHIGLAWGKVGRVYDEKSPTLKKAKMFPEQYELQRVVFDGSPIK